MSLPLIDAPFLPPRNEKGSRARGLTYERKVALFLEKVATSLGWQLHDHPWLAGPMQPDFVLESPSGCFILIEVKLTEVDCSAQLAKYRSLLGNVPALQICRRATNPSTAKVFEDLEQNSTMMLWL